ncbi:MAG: hypothetical protein ACYC18_14840, partial [Gammaproteobacteria bacterium]
ALIEQRRQGALDYRAYLAQIVALTRRVRQPETRDYPVPINSPARRALYDNLKPVEGLEARVRQEDMVADRERDLAATTALALDDAIRAVKKADWRGNRIKEREVHHAIASVILDQPLAATLFEIVKAQRDY